MSVTQLTHSFAFALSSACFPTKSNIFSSTGYGPCPRYSLPSQSNISVSSIVRVVIHTVLCALITTITHYHVLSSSYTHANDLLGPVNHSIIRRPTS